MLLAGIGGTTGGLLEGAGAGAVALSVGMGGTSGLLLDAGEETVVGLSTGRAGRPFASSDGSIGRGGGTAVELSDGLDGTAAGFSTGLGGTGSTWAQGPEGIHKEKAIRMPRA